MAMKYLGETLDIHAGGVDLIFPHHENEIAQSEAITSKPFARFWLHSEFLNVESQKMSKSAGNFYTLRDLQAEGYQPEVVRYLLASVPYRKKLNFTFDGLKAAATAIDRLRNFKLRLETDKYPEGLNEKILERTQAAGRQFEESLDDDLNTAEALAALFEFVRDANTAMDAGEFRAGNTAPALDLLDRFDRIFAVLRTNAGRGRAVRCAGGGADRRNAPPPRRRATSRGPIKSGKSCSTPGSSWKTLKKERAGKGSEVK